MGVKGSEIMKKLSIICLIIAFVLSGCTPKSQVLSSAMDILERVEKTCEEIAPDVEKLGDDYTTGVFENIIKSAGEQKAILSGGPSRDELEASVVTLSRLEKELGSIKILSSGMEDYSAELTFDFANDTGKTVEKIVISSETEGEIEGFNGALNTGEKIAISFPVDVGVWSVTAYVDGGDEVTGEGINLSEINVLTLSYEDGSYAYTAE